MGGAVERELAGVPGGPVDRGRGLSELFHAVATGPEGRRRLLTPVGLVFFCGLLTVVLLASLSTDRAFSLPPLLPGPLGLGIGLLLLGAGVALWLRCAFLFWRAHGTPVPFSPPRVLVVEGPYAWVRNPMMTGAFIGLFGLGAANHSVSMVFVWTPAFVILDILELKLVEEPELERRLGAAYVEYKARVPMFVPRLFGHAG
jgi:protein-S-isoprenylcysteine O-methyltransferase Ste14